MTSDAEHLRSATSISVEPAQLGSAAAAIRLASDRIDSMVVEARRGLVIRPAMADPVTADFAAYATQHHVSASGSFVTMFERYRDELMGIADGLDASRLAYERAEVRAEQTF